MFRLSTAAFFINFTFLLLVCPAFSNAVTLEELHKQFLQLKENFVRLFFVKKRYKTSLTLCHTVLRFKNLRKRLNFVYLKKEFMGIQNDVLKNENVELAVKVSRLETQKGNDVSEYLISLLLVRVHFCILFLHFTRKKSLKTCLQKLLD
jgi:hypothetical protein